MPQIYLISISYSRMLGIRTCEYPALASDTLLEIEDFVIAAPPSRWRVVHIIIAEGRRSN